MPEEAKCPIEKNGRSSVPPQHKENGKSATFAYLIWLFGGSWLGLHLVYLGYPHRAFLRLVTWNFLGFGFVYDLVFMNSFVEMANHYEDYLKQHFPHSKPSVSLLSVLSQYLIGLYFTWFSSCLVPEFTPFADFFYLVFAVCGGCLSIYYTGVAMNDHLKSSLLSMFLLSMLLGLVHHFEFIVLPNINAAVVILDMTVFYFFKEWDITIEPDQKRDTDQEIKQLSANYTNKWKKKLLKSIFIYNCLLTGLGTMTAIGIMNHGRIDVPDKEGNIKSYTIYEAYTNVVNSPLFDEFFTNLNNFYERHENFEETWENLKNDIDVSGEKRALRTLQLEMKNGEIPSRSVIKQAYRKLVLEHHPDKHPHVSIEVKEQINEKFMEIQKAYELLTTKK